MSALQLFSLRDKIAVVTGATGLLGKQHCFALAEAGATVVATDLGDSPLMELVTALEVRTGKKMYSSACDITQKDEVVRLCTFARGIVGTIDVLVNNAAINDMVEVPQKELDSSTFEQYPISAWNKAFEVNVTGMFLCTQAIGSVMAEQRGGSIINIASTYGIVAPNQDLYRDANGLQMFYKPAGYSVTKSAVLGLTRYCAAYWGGSGVRVNALTPGGVQNGQNDVFVRKYAERTMLKRMADKRDYKGALIFLASEASAYMTGANLVVDGGWTAW